MDVYRQIQQIHGMYQDYVEQQQKNSQGDREEVERLTEKLARMEQENANLKKRSRIQRAVKRPACQRHRQAADDRLIRMSQRCSKRHILLPIGLSAALRSRLNRKHSR